MDPGEQIGGGRVCLETVHKGESLLKIPPFQSAGRAGVEMVFQGVQLLAAEAIVRKIGEQLLDFGAWHGRTVYR